MFRRNRYNAQLLDKVSVYSDGTRRDSVSVPSEGVCCFWGGISSLWLPVNEKQHRIKSVALVAAICCGFVVCFAGQPQVARDTEWPNYGNDPGGMRYSPLSDINRGNVSKLKVAWVFHTG